MNNKIFAAFVVIVSIISSSCTNQKKDLIFTKLESERYNLFDIRYTNYKLSGHKIYELNAIGIGSKFFRKTNYLLVDSLKVYSIFNYIDTDESQLNRLFDKSDKKMTHGMRELILDFGLKPKDSIRKLPGDLILIKKEFDSISNDSIYLFSRKFIWNTEITNIIASKKYGIMGVYDYHYTDKTYKEIYKYYGWTYPWLLDSTYLISSRKQLKPYSIKKPFLNLGKINFLDID